MFDRLKISKALAPHRGSPSPRLDKREFKRRFRARFQDQTFDAILAELDRVAETAWDASRIRAKVLTPIFYSSSRFR